MVSDSTISVNCFRASCDANCVYELGKPVSRKFRKLCSSLSVKIPASLSLVKNSFQKMLDSLDDALYTKHVYKEMSIPKGWIKELTPYWTDYYESRRVPTDDIFLVTSGVYKGLTAIPMMFYDKIIGFQIVDPNGFPKYRTLSDNEHTIAVHGGYLDNPVIVVEGILDMACLPNAVAVMRSKLSKEQCYQLRGRDVILLPDRSGNSFIKQAKEYGWKVCIPPWEENDVNSAVQRYGLMVVSQMIKDNVFENHRKANVAYNLWRNNK